MPSQVNERAHYSKLLELVWLALSKTGTPGPPGSAVVRGVFSVVDFGAVGDGASGPADTAAFVAANVAADAAGGSVLVPAAIPGASYTLDADVTMTVPLIVVRGGVIDSPAGNKLTLTNGYEAGHYQVFGATVDVKIRYWTMSTVYFEHFGATVLPGFNDPAPDTDSTVAIQKTFDSMMTSVPVVHNAPGLYGAVVIQLLGTYGISDEILVHPGAYTIYGAGPAAYGQGLKWVGPDVIGNATKAMLRLLGAQFAKVEGLTFTGIGTAVDANRMLAAVAISSRNVLPLDELSRRTWIHRCIVTGGAGGGNSFQHGLLTDGINGNNDFHEWNTVSVAGADSCYTIGHGQNVDIRIINCLAYQPTKCAVWHRHGGELFIDGFYVANLLNGASWFKVGPGDVEGAPNCRWTFRMVGGEGTVVAGGSFIDNTEGDFTTCIFGDFTRCEITLPDIATAIISGPTPSYNLSFRDSNVIGTFVENWETVHRNSVTLDNCRDIATMAVLNTTGQSVVDLHVKNCWGQAFAAPPPAIDITGRFVGPINYIRSFSSFLANPSISLAHPSLYAVTSTLVDRLGIGNAGFGLEAQLTYKSYFALTLTQDTLTLVGAFPANSYIFGCQLTTLTVANWLANSNSVNARIFIGDATDFRRYGTLSDSTIGFAGSVNTDNTIPFGNQLARDVVLTGGWELPGVTYTQAANTVTTPVFSPAFTIAMVGNKFRYTTGPLAGTTVNITGFTDANTVTVDGAPAAGAGEAVQFIPFIADARLLIVPLYLQSMSNIGILAVGARLNLLYAEAATLT
jgi:hypothetical protein